MSILVTGAAGFIGARVCQLLLENGQQVLGIDNLNSYYDPRLKAGRLSVLSDHKNFSFTECDVEQLHTDCPLTPGQRGGITEVIHFAAQAGVRHSLRVPMNFIDTNVRGQIAMLEFARGLGSLRHFIYASSSSVYGRNSAMPFRETDRVDRPGSVYAASKRSAELMSECYQNLYQIPQTGLRFFTVYGPWGRPDMAYFKFARAIVRDEPLTLYDGKNLARDFTYIDDVAGAVLGLLHRPPADGQMRLLNVGNSQPSSVSTLVNLLETHLQRKARIAMTSRPAADVEKTWASTDAIRALTGWSPVVTLEEGTERFIRWFRDSPYAQA